MLVRCPSTWECAEHDRHFPAAKNNRTRNRTRTSHKSLPTLTLRSLLFGGGGGQKSEEPTKKVRIFLSASLLKSLKKKGDHAPKGEENRKTKKARKSKKARIGNSAKISKKLCKSSFELGLSLEVCSSSSPETRMQTRKQLQDQAWDELLP